jgi:hypothetical protein
MLNTHRTELEQDFIVELNTERDTALLVEFYTNVPLDRQALGRQLLHLAGRIMARSPFYQEGLLRVLSAMNDSTFDGDDIYVLSLDAEEVIRGDLVAMEPPPQQPQQSVQESVQQQAESQPESHELPVLVDFFGQRDVAMDLTSPFERAIYSPTA